MPPRPKPPRLWLRPAQPGRSAIFLILDRGQQHPTGTADQAEAERALADYITRKHTAALGNGKLELDQIPVCDVLNHYAATVGPKHAQPAKSASRIVRLIKFFTGKTLADVNGALCREYEKTVATDAVARRDLEDLRAAINFHRREGLHDRIVSVVMPPARPPRERWLTRDEAAALIWRLWRAPGNKSKHVAKFALVALYTGRRAGAVLSASFKREPGRAWIDTRKGMLWPPERAKQTRKRNPAIPLPNRLLAHLRRWERKGARYAVQYAGKPVNRATAVKRAAKAAGLGLVTPHVLRHTAATWQMIAGTDLFQAGRFLGMTTRTLEKNYAHHAPEHLTGAANAYERIRRSTTNRQ
jgi:integrase